VTALLEYLDLVVQALCLQVVIFSAAEEYLFDFFWQYLGIILGIIGK